MKNSRHLWLLLIFVWRISSGQSHIMNAEYFFDHDPGVGHGTALTITLSGATVTQTSLIPVSGLSPGLHYLFIRCRDTVRGSKFDTLMKKDSTLMWSIVMAREFLIQNPASLTQSKIAKAEYYFDHDPGVGNGTALPSFTSAYTVNVAADNIPTTGLSPGLHYLFIRAQNNAGSEWSLVLSREFLIQNAASLTQSKIAKAEYYFDHDPGLGNGTALPSFTSAYTVNVAADNIPTTGLSPGLHYLFIRAQNNAGSEWSIILGREFLIPNPATLVQSDIVKAEYYIDHDPGVGHGTALPSFTGANTVNVAADNIPVTGYSPGVHWLFIRALNNAGSEWSIVLERAFQVLPNIPQPKIVKAEYFVDNDPGIGNGTPITPAFAAGATVDTLRTLTVSNSLSLGRHYLCMRAKSDSAKWSIVMVDSFYVETPVVATTTVTANVMCNGGNNGDASANPSGGTSPYTYSWSNGTSTVSVTNPTGSVLSAGTYTVTVTDNLGNSGTESVTITQPTVVGISLSSVTNVSCNVEGTATAHAATGGVSPYTYSWTSGGGTNLTATGLSGGTYTITVTDNHGCAATASATITQSSSTIAISISSVTDVSCYGGTGTATASAATGGTSPYTYSWSSGGGTSLVRTGLSAGTYTITATDNHGCSTTASATITQPANALGTSIYYVGNVYCFGGPGYITANSATGGTSPYTYSWSGSGGTNLTTLSLTAGTYTITVKDNNGCSTTVSATITQPATSLGTTITSVENVSCYGGTGSVTVNSTGGTSPYTYIWSSTSTTETAPTITTTGLSAGTYTITVTDNNGCVETISVTITQPASPLGISVTSVTNVSCSVPGKAIASAATGGTSPYTYSWSPSGGTNLTATGLSAGTYTITSTDNHGCTATALATITQAANTVEITISSVTNVSCRGGTGTVRANAASGGTSPYTYSWSPGGGTNLTTTAISAGTYTITVTDNHGCTSIVSATITQPAAALGVALSSVTDVSCHGGTGTATASAATGGTSPYSYSWSGGGGTTVSATGLTAGTYTLTTTDNHGCSATITTTVTQPASVLGITIASVTNVSCNGGTGTVRANAATGGTSPYTYSWSATGGTNLTTTAISAGTYTITVKDNHGCTETVSATVSQPASALGVTISSVTDVNCNIQGSATAHAATGGTSPYTYSWSGGRGSNLTVTGLSAGTYTFEATDNHGCTSTVSATITQPASSLGITISSVSNIRCNGGVGSAIANTGTGGTSPYTYSWSSGGGSSVTASGLSAGVYTITATDSHGCIATASATVTQPASSLGITLSSVMDVSCYGGTGNAIANPGTGGTSPYTYSWSGGGGTNVTATGLLSGVYTITATDNNGCLATASVTITQPAFVLGITISSVINVSCNGGAGTAIANTATGGTSPYTYSWSGGGGTNVISSNLTAGIYTITTTDNHGCTASITATITQPAVIGISISSQTDISCFGDRGSATATAATGGTSPYTYSWSSGSSTVTQTNLSAGIYTITATDSHGCRATASVTITSPVSALGVSIASHINISCNGGIGSATVNAATGGTSPYTYSWSGGGGTNLSATGLSAGVYTLTTTDNHGCTATLSVNITQPAALSIAISSQVNISCYGDNNGKIISHGAGGGTSPYTYSWSSGGGSSLTASNLTAGIYIITATDSHGCTATTSATITQPASAMIITTDSVNQTTDLPCNGKASVTVLSGGTLPYTYRWTTGGQTTDTIKNQCGGQSYCCEITDNHGCSQSVCVTIRNTTGVVDIDNSALINIYPNPNTGQFTVAGVEDGMMIELYDAIGRKISVITAVNETMQINISDQADGIYLIRIIDKKGNFVTDKKMIKIQ